MQISLLSSMRRAEKLRAILYLVILVLTVALTEAQKLRPGGYSVFPESVKGEGHVWLSSGKTVSQQGVTVAFWVSLNKDELFDGYIYDAKGIRELKSGDSILFFVPGLASRQSNLWRSPVGDRGDWDVIAISQVESSPEDLRIVLKDPVRTKAGELITVMTFTSRPLAHGELVYYLSRAQCGPEGKKCVDASLAAIQADQAAKNPPPASQKMDEKTSQKTDATTDKNATIGDRILDDTEFFSADFAKSVRSATAGKGRAVPSPCPKVAKVEEKYGKPDKTELRTVSVENGPTVMLSVHYYGDIGLGVANELVMTVVKR